MCRQIKGMEIVQENELIGEKEIKKKKIASKKGGSLSSMYIFSCENKKKTSKISGKKLH